MFIIKPIFNHYKYIYISVNKKFSIFDKILSCIFIEISVYFNIYINKYIFIYFIYFKF
jgi:hypothetical protein